MTNKEKLANYEMMKNECFETRKLNDSLGKLVVVKNKEIKELEHENKVLAQNLEDTEIVNKALEKENAELKEELKALRESIKDYGAGCYENGLRNGKRKLEEQLTKAKELLKEFVHHYKDKTIYIENMQDLLEQVERFLKDLEK